MARKFMRKATAVDSVVVETPLPVTVEEILPSAEEVTPAEEEVVVPEVVENTQAPEEVEAWEVTLTKDVNEVISKFITMSKQAGWAVKYHKPVLESYENGSVKYDEQSCNGVTMYIQFDFNEVYKKETVIN